MVLKATTSSTQRLKEDSLKIPVTQAAIADGTAQPAPPLEAVTAPEGAEVEVGGRACKWCWSKTHLRRSHKDCPSNTEKYAFEIIIKITVLRPTVEPLITQCGGDSKTVQENARSHYWE